MDYWFLTFSAFKYVNHHFKIKRMQNELPTLYVTVFLSDGKSTKGKRFRIGIKSLIQDRIVGDMMKTSEEE